MQGDILHERKRRVWEPLHMRLRLCKRGTGFKPDNHIEGMIYQ